VNTHPLLSVRGLTVTMPAQSGPTTVVADVDFDIAPGEAFGLVGESGCGKTTTLRAILRLMPPVARLTAGQVRFAGADLATMTTRELRHVRGGQIGVIWQDPLAALDPVIRVGPQVAETVRAHEPVGRAIAASRAKDLMRLVELPDISRTYDAYPHELSGGQRQRVVIAAAIAAQPKLLLADEPTTALDVTVQDQVLRLLARLRSELGLALLLVSHDLAVVSETCDRVAVMYAGRIVETGPTGPVLDAPCHPYTHGLLRAAPQVDHIGQRPAGIPGAPPVGAQYASCAFAPRCARADHLCDTVLPTLHWASSTRPQDVACHHPLGGLENGSVTEPAAVRDDHG
jgi:oligopeptide/dipeptide ABC transporter ATP-binding protein